MLKDTNQIVGTAIQKVIESGCGNLSEEDRLLRDQMFEEAGIDIEQDTLQDVFNKLVDWLDSDSALVKKIIERSANEWIKGLPTIDEIKIGQREQ